MAAKTATKTTAKPKDQDKPAPRLADIEGFDLLVPFDKVKGSDQVRLLSRVRDLGLLDGSGNTGIADLDLDAVADLIDFVGERYAKDPAKFEEFTTGKGGFSRAMNLVVVYAGELGNVEA